MPIGLFEDRLDADPADWSLRNAYAAALDDAGEHDLAYAQRWMAHFKRHPVKSSAHERYFRWEPGMTGSTAFIERPVADAIDDYHFPGRQTCEQKLAKALATLRQVVPDLKPAILAADSVL